MAQQQQQQQQPVIVQWVVDTRPLWTGAFKTKDLEQIV
jgi:hypothetical protein